MAQNQKAPKTPCSFLCTRDTKAQVTEGDQSGYRWVGKGSVITVKSLNDLGLLISAGAGDVIRDENGKETLQPQKIVEMKIPKKRGRPKKNDAEETPGE